VWLLAAYLPARRATRVHQPTPFASNDAFDGE
jgi:hypothetical protein